jgi:serine protease Do
MKNNGGYMRQFGRCGKSFARGFAVLTALLLVMPGALGQAARQETLSLRVDPEPLAQDLKQRTSFAPVVAKVAPSVVNVYSTRTVRDRGPVFPFFNDPFLRRFFGGEGEERQQQQQQPRPRTQQGLGSGVIVSEDGYIITNSHVVDGATDIRVALADGQEYNATIIGTDPATDIAVLRVEATGLPAITWADSATIEVGDTVLAIGNPFGVGQTVTSGIVSAVGRGGFGIVDYEDFIQTDASINPGNSGGALTDVTGRLIGINMAIISRTGGAQGVGFAVPTNIARFTLEQIVQHGRVVRGYLGVYVQPLTPELARMFKVGEQRGALVASVNPRSPAARAGIQEGDIITEFHGREITDSRQLRLMVAQTPPNTQAEVTVVRDGREEDLMVRLGELQGEEVAQARGGAEPQAQAGRTGFLEGLELTEIDNTTRRQLALPPNVQGLIITSVEPGSPAERAGLRPRDIITEINRQPVNSIEDARAIRREMRGQSLLLRVQNEEGSRYVVMDPDRGQTQPMPRR